MLAVPNPQHVELLALLDITRGKQVNPANKKPALEYPTAGSLLRPRKTNRPYVQLGGESAGLLESEVGLDAANINS